ncbi:hypothetical protein Q4R99_11530 [Morganella morganii]
MEDGAKGPSASNVVGL